MKTFFYSALVIIPLLLPGRASGEDFNLNTQMVNTTTQEVLANYKSSGGLENLFAIEKAMVGQILARVGINPATLPAQVQQDLANPATTSFQAFVSYSVGLDLLDQGRFQDARIAFRLAAKLDPNFQEATNQEMKTPRSSSGLNEMKREAMENALRTVDNLLSGRLPVIQRFAPPGDGSPGGTAAKGRGKTEEKSAQKEGKGGSSVNKEKAPPPTNGTGGKPGGAAPGKSQLTALIDQTLGTIQATSTQVSQLNKQNFASSQEAVTAIKNAVAQKADLELVTEAVLGQMKNPSTENIAQILREGGKMGLTADSVDRIARSRGGNGSCP